MEERRKIMPGCEKLTRPEEISALKDYLKQGIANRDSLLTTEDVLIQTPEDPILRDVNLEERDLVMLDGSKTKINLDSNKISLEVPGNIKPGDSLVNLKGGKDISPLEINSPMSVPGSENSSVRPSEYIATITGNNKNELPEKVLRIEKNDPEVKSDIRNLRAKEDPKPEDYREQLSIPDKSSLYSFLSVLDVPENPKPSNKVYEIPENAVKPKETLHQILENFQEPEEYIFPIEENRVGPKEELKIIEENIVKPKEDIKEIEKNSVEPNPRIHSIQENNVELTEVVRTIEESNVDPKSELHKIQENTVEPEEHIQTLEKTETDILRKFHKIEERDVDLPDAVWKLARKGEVRLPEGSVKLGLDKEEPSLNSSKSLIPGDRPNIGEDKIKEDKAHISEREKDPDWPGDNGSKNISIPESKKDLIDENFVNPSDHQNLGYPILPRIATVKTEGESDYSVTLKEAQASTGIKDLREQDYLNLGDIEYETFCQIKAAVSGLSGSSSENWAKRLMSYLQAIFSRTEKYRKTLNEADRSLILSALKGSETGDIYKVARTLDKYYRPKEDSIQENAAQSSDRSVLEVKDSEITKSKIEKNERVSSERGIRPRHRVDGFKNWQDKEYDVGLGLRWAAEEIVGQDGSSSSSLGKAYDVLDKINGGGTKQDVLDAVLYALVTARDTARATTHNDPSRLPGNPADKSILSQGIGALLGVGDTTIAGTASKILDNIFPGGTKEHPLNYPVQDMDTWDNGSGNPRKLGEYTRGAGFMTTLEDLCLESSSTLPYSLEDLKETIEKSPYITTANKVTGPGRVMTLDSNHTWELKLYPYIGELNGHCSWLPNIAEINSINYYEHGVNTGWGHWIPVNSFELQTRKMTQKTLGLYDGEISYPVSMEFTNELRLTLIDDQYKSWKRYFELCSECSTYLTQMKNYEGSMVKVLTADGRLAHGVRDYTTLDSNDLLSYADTTPIVKGTISPGMYKNLAFRCVIYVMTPQMSTIKKFDLLVVMKDYSIEYTGESDASSPDLTISFSIVGENPGESLPQVYNDSLSSVRQKETTTFLKEKLGKGGIGNILKGGLSILS